MSKHLSSSTPTLKKPLVYSAIFHLIFFIVLLSVPGLNLRFGNNSKKIDVQWVELPKGTGEDIDFGVQKSQGLPKSTIEEQKQLFQPEKSEQQNTMKPEMKAPTEKAPEKQATAKPEKRPTVDTSKMTIADKNSKLKALPAPKADRKIKDALAMIDKDLKGRQVIPESAQVESEGKGYKYGTSDKPLRVSPSDPEYIKYQAMVRSKIIRAWVVPSVYADAMGKRYNTRIDVTINTDGDVVYVRLAKASGNTSFDQSAMRAVKNASPFPRPPERLSWEAYNEGFLVEFDARLKPQ